MKFTHLHVHSHYSLLDGLPKIDELLDKCQELGINSIALTDHGSMYGLVEFFQKAKARGIKAILGCELYLARDSMDLRRPKIDEERHHLVLLIKNKTGYRNLIQLSTKGHLQGFYYKPRVDKNLLKKHSDGLIALSGCLQGEVAKALVADKFEKAEKLALEYQRIFGQGNFYLELQDHPHLPHQIIANQGLVQIAQKHRIPLVATNDVHYLNPEDSQAQDILLCIQTNHKVQDQDRLSMQGDDFSLRPSQQMIESFQDIPEAIENTQKIIEQCQFEFELGQTKLPHFEVPKSYTADSYLKKMAYQGLAKRYGRKINQKILKRLEHELALIKKTGFSSYFLIVADFVNWAKENNIVVGPGRGSASGSIVSYLLNITDVDPLKYDLLFERFMSGERIAPPDIDLDFADDRRDEVIDYIKRKYGDDHVAQIITFGTMAARAAIRDTGRALGYAYNFCDQVAKTIPMFSTLEEALKRVADLRQLYQTDSNTRKLIDSAKKLEGVARHASTHACGLVITKDKIDQYIPRQHASQDDQTIVSQYEMHAIEDLGLLKIDLLGLKNLTILEKAAELIKKRHNIGIDFNKIPLDDKKTFKIFQDAQTTSLFQYESSGMKRYLKQLQPTKFEDLIAMVALYRPGPMKWIPDFIAGKHNPKRVRYLHPKLKPILEKTYGVVLYQEQLLQIAKDLAGFTLIEADVLRKAVGKKIRGLMTEQKAKFVQGCLANKIKASIAEKIFAFIEPHASYSFNRSHSTCYATIGYRTAYLKAHYPAEFMAALLTSDQGNIDRIAIEVEECNRMKINILPPAINQSYRNFTVVDDQTIRFGLGAIKNVGHNVITAIISARQQKEFSSIEDFIERVQSKDLNKKSLEALIKCGALDQLGERSQLLTNLEQLLNHAREIQKVKANGQESLFSIDQTPQLKLKEAEPASKKEKLAWEKELLGLYISEHPVKDYQNYLSHHALTCQDLSSRMVGHQVKLGGIINKIKKIITRSKKPMLFVELEDLTGKIEVLVFPNVLLANPDVWQENRIILVNGLLDDRDGSLKLLCNNANEITKQE